jgi:tripartite-type tricarboxylate transporter receptor subunit TctC
VPVSFQLIPNVAAHLTTGEVKPLAVTTKTRSRSLPNVPTMAEEGVQNYESYAWFGLAAPKGTPAPILDRLHAELVKTIADPSVQARLIEIGVEPTTNMRDEFKTFISSEIVKWRDIIQSAGIKGD